MTSLSRPLRRLLEMGIVDRATPFGTSPRDSKRTLYRIADPFLRFWFRFVEPNRSRLEAGRAEAVAREVWAQLSLHAGEVWEDLARASVPRLGSFDRTWGPAERWWGPGLDRRPMEVDLVAESETDDALLLGEVKWSPPRGAPRVLAELDRKARNLPFAQGRQVLTALWLKQGTGGETGRRVVTPRQVLAALR